jgi:hypothetical protein
MLWGNLREKNRIYHTLTFQLPLRFLSKAILCNDLGLYPIWQASDSLEVGNPNGLN